MQTTPTLKVLGPSLAGALALTAATAHAQTQNYPVKPVSIIVPFSAGGDADQSARNLMVTAQELLKQPIVIVNRPGANGAIGSQAVLAAPPDGYTLLLARVGSQAILPALKPPATLKYAWNDFTFIGLLEVNPVVCVVHPDSPYKTLSDLSKALKAQPGKLNYASSGPATVQNFAPQVLLQSLKLKPDAAVGVQYKGGSEVAMAVLTRDVDFACNNLSSMAGNISGGKLRALVTTTTERLKQFPSVPTASEEGHPDMEAVVGWSALYGPARMEPEAVKRWVDVLNKAAADPRWITANGTYGGIPRVISPAETEKFVNVSFNLYQKLGQKLGIDLN
ncbi:tripartite tricarboxylate transporter substrate binding protein [Paucibacter sp. PLA-PC-4]|uniref:tripartite tricarboxylate transporter substrate binding protein n=1 Tax=Paucibacter sp. PLA-PC-4 TaxID=2993655 RepID=UPI00224A813F|nr:tripartite tricarboxylate transporter substrate binding protein [Paucibacter sp. PLA-PC-4]MCX2863703.1 tripartite tricarboxylate transporter substrate binding protein [Paucibacter sp. PLA-PC-4]